MRPAFIVAFLIVFALSNVVIAQAPPKLPNIGYIGYGYNIFYGNPHDTSNFDPGFGQAPIWTFSYSQQQTTTDGKWLVPDNVAVPGAATECNVQGTSQTVRSAYDYQSTLSNDCKVDFSGFGASFSASTDYKKVELATGEEEDIYVTTSASCQTYLVDINAYVHPNFSEVILTQGAKLPTTFNPQNASAFWEFFDLVGTHFATQIVFGSRWGYSFQSTQSQWSTMQQIGLDINVAAGYAGLVKAGVSVNNSYARQMAANFSSLTVSILEYSLGLPPPSNGDTADWLLTSLSSTDMDPLQYTLTNISMLFSSEYTDNQALIARYEAVYQALQQYCQLHLVANGILTSCAQPPPPPPPPPPVGYGALACATSNGKGDCHSTWAFVADGTSNIQAQEVVMDFCPTCTIVATFSNGGCLGCAISSAHSAWGCVWGGVNQTEMNLEAVAACQKVSQGGACDVVVSGCSAPPPTGAQWGAIACTEYCNSYIATKTGYPDRIEAHKIAMGELANSFVAIDFDQCGAVVKSSGNGYAAASADTPQDATNNAMASCQATLQGCHLLTYACVDDSFSPPSPQIHTMSGSNHNVHHDSASLQPSKNGIVIMKD